MARLFRNNHRYYSDDDTNNRSFNNNHFNDSDSVSSPYSDIEYARNRLFTSYEPTGNERGELDADIREYYPNSRRNYNTRRAGVFNTNSNQFNGGLNTNDNNPNNTHNFHNLEEPRKSLNSHRLKPDLAYSYKQRLERDKIQPTRERPILGRNPDVPLSTNALKGNSIYNNKAFGNPVKYNNWNGDVPEVYWKEKSFFKDLEIDPKEKYHNQLKKLGHHIHEKSTQMANEVLRKEKAARLQNLRNRAPAAEYQQDNNHNSNYVMNQNKVAFTETPRNSRLSQSQSQQLPYLPAAPVAESKKMPSLKSYAPSPDIFEHSRMAPRVGGDTYSSLYRSVNPRIEAYKEQFPEIIDVPMDESDVLLKDSIKSMMNKSKNTAFSSHHTENARMEAYKIQTPEIADLSMDESDGLLTNSLKVMINKYKDNESKFQALVDTLNFMSPMKIQAKFIEIEREREALEDQMVAEIINCVRRGHNKPYDILSKLQDLLKINKFKFKNLIAKFEASGGASMVSLTTSTTALKEDRIKNHDYENKASIDPQRQISNNQHLSSSSFYDATGEVVEDISALVKDALKKNRSSPKETREAQLTSTTDEEFQSMKPKSLLHSRQKKSVSKEKQLADLGLNIDNELMVNGLYSMKSKSYKSHEKKTQKKPVRSKIESDTESEQEPMKFVSKNSRANLKKKAVHSEVDEESQSDNNDATISRRRSTASKNSRANLKMETVSSETDEESQPDNNNVTISRRRSTASKNSRTSLKKKPVYSGIDEESQSDNNDVIVSRRRSTASKNGRANLKMETVSSETDEESQPDNNNVTISRRRSTASNKNSRANLKMETVSSETYEESQPDNNDATVSRREPTAFETRNKVPLISGGSYEFKVYPCGECHEPVSHDLMKDPISTGQRYPPVAEPLGDRSNARISCNECTRVAAIKVSDCKYDILGRIGTLNECRKQLVDQSRLSIRDARVLLSRLKPYFISYSDLDDLVDNTNDYDILPKDLQDRLERDVTKLLSNLSNNVLDDSLGSEHPYGSESASGYNRDNQLDGFGINNLF